MHATPDIEQGKRHDDHDGDDQRQLDQSLSGFPPKCACAITAG
jgi:hypothetical protein